MLIEPDLVLTAGHCVTHGAIPGFNYRPSTADGTPGNRYYARGVVLHPTWRRFAAIEEDGRASIARDLALIRLAVPVPADEARPMPMGVFPEEGGSVVLASYRRGGVAPLMVRDCPVRSVQTDVFVIGCAVRSGESGSPVFAMTADGPAVAGILSRQSMNGGDEQALGATTGETMDVLLRFPPP